MEKFSGNIFYSQEKIGFEERKNHRSRVYKFSTFSTEWQQLNDAYTTIFWQFIGEILVHAITHDDQLFLCEFISQNNILNYTTNSFLMVRNYKILWINLDTFNVLCIDN